MEFNSLVASPSGRRQLSAGVRQHPTSFPVHIPIIRPLLALLALALAAAADAQTAPLCRDTLAPEAPFRAALQAYGADDPSEVTLESVCGMRATAVASIWASRRDKARDYGPRFVVLRLGKAGRARCAYASKGMMDAALPELWVYALPGRALVLADIGNEGSWGLSAYEVTPARVRDLGLLDVGKPASFSSDPDGSALEHASVALVGGRWQVGFDTTVVLRPNDSRNRRVLAGGPTRPVVFRFAKGAWRRLG